MQQKLFYWRLRGALENRNCEFYTEKEKERGLSKLNEILSANGLDVVSGP